MLVKLIVSTLMFLSIVSSLDASELKVYDSDMSFDSFEMEVFEDQSTQLTIDEIIQVNRFSKTKNSISRGYSQSNFWFRFDIRNQTNDTLT
ncbi:MAG: 7TM-DISM domain-containing protein, partial [Campylobacterota bacterium]|nr:7TM-DISM domain-containing protein [Campylobacterota bacterium]